MSRALQHLRADHVLIAADVDVDLVRYAGGVRPTVGVRVPVRVAHQRQRLAGLIADPGELAGLGRTGSCTARSRPGRSDAVGRRLLRVQRRRERLRHRRRQRHLKCADEERIRTAWSGGRRSSSSSASRCPGTGRPSPCPHPDHVEEVGREVAVADVRVGAALDRVRDVRRGDIAVNRRAEVTFGLDVHGDRLAAVGDPTVGTLGPVARSARSGSLEFGGNMNSGRWVGYITA